ncbi:MAG: NUDIX hydrolase [Caulobacter sp.]|nr:NUDIX hydrolase [Caulobacter sp.]
MRERLRGVDWVAHRQQYAALPWRQGKNGVEILMITSRETRRWVIPKGWPMITLAAHDAAAQEAWEEAGVRGEVDAIPVGAFRYRKRMKSGPPQRCRVDVYPLAVSAEEKDWPERRQRDRRWIPALEAARMVEETELRAIIEAFAGSKGG